MKLLPLALLPLLLVSHISPISETQTVSPVFPYQVTARRALRVPIKYQATIEREAFLAKIPSEILARVIQAESNWNPICTSINKNGTIDSGIAQLNSRYLDEFAWRYNLGKPIDAYNPEEAIRIACLHLARLQSVTGNWRDTIASYNAGLTRVRTGNIPKTTEKYLGKVFE